MEISSNYRKCGERTIKKNKSQRGGLVETRAAWLQTRRVGIHGIQSVGVHGTQSVGNRSTESEDKLAILSVGSHVIECR